MHFYDSCFNVAMVERDPNLFFMTFVGVLVEDAHPGHDLRTVGAGPHLLIVVRVVFVVPENLHRGKVVVTPLAIKPSRKSLN
jgi:hypothetical protein